jgi:hypothetical protein
MKNINTKLIAILIAILPVMGYAQTAANKDSALALFKEMINTYRRAGYLSFQLEYTYKNAANPEVVLDSINGQVKMNKDNYHLLLGNTETIHNDKYNVTLYKQDSLIYVSKSSIEKNIINPVSIIDSMLTKIHNIDISLTSKRNLQIISINFPDSTNYKSAEFVIDKKNGYLFQVRYKVNITQMLGHSENNNPKGASQESKWGLIRTRYYNYKVNTFDDSEFDDKKYFIKKGSEFKPTDLYKHYKIFIATPGI